MSAETDTQAAAVANTSGITPASIKTTLTEKLEAQHVEIDDISGISPPFPPLLSISESHAHTPISGGCGQAFEATIVSSQFAKKTTLARHRLVNSALKAEIAAIHAWTPKCFTPEEWQRKQAQEGVGLPQGV